MLLIIKLQKTQNCVSFNLLTLKSKESQVCTVPILVENHFALMLSGHSGDSGYRILIRTPCALRPKEIVSAKSSEISLVMNLSQANHTCITSGHSD